MISLQKFTSKFDHDSLRLPMKHKRQQHTIEQFLFNTIKTT